MSWEGKRKRPHSQCAKTARCILVTSNIAAIMIGAILVALCLWVLLDPALFEVRNHLRLFASYKAGLYVAVTAAVGVCLLSMFGYCVSWNSSSKGLLIYSLFCLALIICQIAVMSLIFKYTASNKLGPFLSRAIREMLDRSKATKKDAVSFLNRVQELYSCCGGFSYTDYTENEMDIPLSCYSGEAVIQERGCGPVLTEHFKINGLAIGLIALALLFLQVILCACAWTQFFEKRVVRKRLAASFV